jgi:hypothetical protein
MNTTLIMNTTMNKSFNKSMNIQWNMDISMNISWVSWPPSWFLSLPGPAAPLTNLSGTHAILFDWESVKKLCLVKNCVLRTPSPLTLSDTGVAREYAFVVLDP